MVCSHIYYRDSQSIMDTIMDTIQLTKILENIKSNRLRFIKAVNKRVRQIDGQNDYDAKALATLY